MFFLFRFIEGLVFWVFLWGYGNLRELYGIFFFCFVFYLKVEYIVLYIFIGVFIVDEVYVN